MAYWEFLLQQEGDRSWLPLETTHVEILEGRYRIVAHTSHHNTAVEVQLIQVVQDTQPPKRRGLKRQGQTNGEGLMAVMPFTHLVAGTWTVRCRAAEARAEAWEYGVQLQVLPVEADPEGWAPDWELPDPAQDLGQIPELANLAHPANQDSPGVPLTSAPGDLIPTAEAPPDLDTAQLTALPLRLRLEQQALVARQGVPVVLRGEVVAAAEEPMTLGENAHLWVQLRNPETGAIVSRLSRSLPLDQGPFTLTVPLPEHQPTRLLVGEMSLWQGTPPEQVIALQGFTITINLDTLLEVVANQGEQGRLDPFVATASPETTASVQEPAPPLQIPRPRDIPFRQIYLPTTGLTLPPQIHRPESTRGIPSAMVRDRPKGAIALPALPNQTVRTSHPANPNRPDRALELPPLAVASLPPETAPDAPVDRPLDLPNFVKEPPAPSFPAEAATAADVPAFTGDTGDMNASTDPDFQALRLQDRFWSRLSALAQDGHTSAASLKTEMQAAGLDLDSSAPEINLPTLPTPVPNSPAIDPEATAQEAIAFEHEVVMYDADPNFPEPTPVSGASDIPTAALGPDALEDIPVVPVPELDLPEGDLIAGTPITVVIRLPRLPQRLAVKFWMTDIQSRSLVEKPRWLMTWTPLEGERQETVLQIQVPMGCLAARFEAIAIDLTNQQESRKVALHRTIIPPHLLDLPADEDI
ncbi:hypothetical protein [Leptolyngbya sp. PCC 6406]|uniref:hypothetical protein n=1 Tax=Leptolyngbya sp. PCC 6406 TaxID=1173264 RepID=UPI0002AC17C1|nr:hypothetical protein [Leptolyngbya sp. PCC 6406]